MINGLKEGDRVPDFTLFDQHGQSFRLSQKLLSGPVVLFFYPKDNSPGCTLEACSFRDSYLSFMEEGAVVAGISSDPEESHRSFGEKHQLPYPLLSDTDGKVKAMFGLTNDFFEMLPPRVSFVISQDGVIRKRFKSQIRPTRHITEALMGVKEYRQSGIQNTNPSFAG